MGIHYVPQPMFRPGFLFLLTLVVVSLPAHGAESPSGMERLARIVDRRVRPVEERIATLEKQMHEWPEPEVYPVRSLGFRSAYAAAPDARQWIQLDLGTPVPLDGVVLVGAHLFTTGQGQPGYAFPRSFRVEVSNDAGFSEVRTLGEFVDFPNPGDLPVFVESRGAVARYVRITVTQLASVDGQWFFALGELMILAGNRNLAEALPGGAVTSSDPMELGGGWGVINVIDGVSVLGSPTSLGASPTRGWRTPPKKANEVAWCRLDLGREIAVDEVRIVPARMLEMPGSGSYAFPAMLSVAVLSGPTEPRWPEYKNPTNFRLTGRGGNPMVLDLGRKKGRFVVVRIQSMSLLAEGYRGAFSEIQVYAQGRNVALGTSVTASVTDDGDGWSAAALTDGFSSAHPLVELPGWLRGLSQQRERLNEIAGLRVEQAHRLSQAVHRAEQGVFWSVSALVAGAGAAVWGVRLRRRREIAALRERIARDLHDEIGSNLGGIAMLSEVAARIENLPEAARDEFAEIRDIARQTHETMHDLVWLLKNDDDTTLRERLEATARALLPAVEWSLEFTGQPIPARLPLDFRRHLFLAFKEALHNVGRHARAQAVSIRVHGEARRLLLTVSDDGCGFDRATITEGLGLASLRSRAETLGGCCAIESRPGNGTTVAIHVPMLPDHGFLK